MCGSVVSAVSTLVSLAQLQLNYRCAAADGAAPAPASAPATAPAPVAAADATAAATAAAAAAATSNLLAGFGLRDPVC